MTYYTYIMLFATVQYIFGSPRNGETMFQFTYIMVIRYNIVCTLKQAPAIYTLVHKCMVRIILLLHVGYIGTYAYKMSADECEGLRLDFINWHVETTIYLDIFVRCGRFDHKYLCTLFVNHYHRFSAVVVIIIYAPSDFTSVANNNFFSKLSYFLRIYSS